MQNQRDFKGVWIPKKIWVAKDLGWTEKLVLVELDSLDNENGCFASNDYLAEFFKLSKDRISRIISSLKEKGYITVELHYKQGTKQIEKRVIRSNIHQYPIGENTNTLLAKTTIGIGENTNTPIGENTKDNNTSFNNTSNNTINKTDSGQASGQNEFAEIVQYVNQNIQIVTPFIHETLGYIYDDYKDKNLILAALQKSTLNSKVTNKLKYAEATLKNWNSEFITTYQQLLDKEVRDSKNKSKQKDEPKYYDDGINF